MKKTIAHNKPAGLDERSLQLRRTLVKVLATAGRGHMGPALSMVEILRVLYDEILRYDAKNPSWPGRDRFILSKGHGCASFYVMLAEKGFFPEEELWRIFQFDALLGGHPESHIPGVEASTGSLGHGLPIGVGMALNAKIKKLDYRVFVLLGDGESQEGSVWEAAMSAAKHKLDNLVAIVDYNKSQAYGSTAQVLDLEPFADKWRSFGFSVREPDGHNLDELRRALGSVPAEKGKPAAVICHTVKGKGIPFAENNMAWHHKSKFSDEDIKALLDALGGADA